MSTLNLHCACTVIKIRQSSDFNHPLDEQVEENLGTNPLLVFDVAEVNFGSMQMGELVNVYHRFTEIWKNEPHLMALINLNKTGKEVFGLTKLNDTLPSFDSLEGAFSAFTSLDPSDAKVG